MFQIDSYHQIETYEKVERLIYKICSKYQYVNKMYALEDLISESYIAFNYAYNHYSSDKGSFITYFYLALNHHLLKVINHKNINSSSLNVPLEDDKGEVGDLIEDDTINFEEILFQQELKYLLNRKLDDLLTLKERKYLLLYHYDNISMPDIALIEGCCKENVRRRFVSAYRKLRHDPELKAWYIANINENYYN